MTNPTLVDHILLSNPEITSPHRIMELQKVKFPEVTEDSLILRAKDGSFENWLGTFLEYKQAENFIIELPFREKQIEIRPRRVSPNELWYRAVAGTFQTRGECLQSIQELRRNGLLPIFKGLRVH